MITHATQCTHCFTIFNVYNDYHIFVGGVESTSEPNPSVQFPNWIQFERSKDYANDLVGFVNDVFKSYCVVGVSATLNSVPSAVAFPVNWPQVGYVYEKDNFKFLIWAVKDECPGMPDTA